MCSLNIIHEIYFGRAISIKCKQTPRDNLCQTDPYSNTKLKLIQICDKDGNREASKSNQAKKKKKDREASLRSYDYNKKNSSRGLYKRKKK